jgi:RNA polymerase sigma-70 factor (ECF subfamily)
MDLRDLFFGHDPLRQQLEHWRPALYRVAYSWCHDRALADDLVQDTLVKAMSRRAQLRDSERLKGWLFAILNNGFRDHLRRQRAHDDIDELADEMPGSLPSPEDDRATTEVVARVRAAIATLPLGQRQVVTLVDLEELSYAEVAHALAIPIGTVMSRLCRARAALRHALTDDRATAQVIALGSPR